MKKPNIIVFFSDQQRYDSVGCNGQPLDVTPRLDAMAKEGVNFKMAYTAQPVCGPARAMLQSGLYPTETGCFRNGIPLPLDCDSLARRLKRADYHVAYVGKWHLASEEQLDFRTSPIPLERRGGYDEYWVAADVLEFTSHGYGGYLYDADGNKKTFTGYRTDCVTDYALEYIDEQPWVDGKPFFLFLSHIEPHHQNDRDCFEGPAGSREKFADFVPPPELEPGKGDWEQQYPDYLGCCNALDRNLGRVLDKLKEKGLYDDTIVIYTSDHGCHFKTKKDEAAAGGFDDYKRNCYENTIHIPMVARGPGFEQGTVDNRLASLLDIPMTIADAAGADGTGMRGNSLLRPDDRERQEVYIQISESFVGRAIRTERYTYCVYAPHKHPGQCPGSDVYEDRYLFDNMEDPCQKRNLIGERSFDEIKAELRARLIACAEEAGEGKIMIEKGGERI